MSESSTSGRCAWLVVEGLRAEEKAADFDRQGQSAQAALHHSRAASKFKEAAEICPDADREELEGHAQDITARAVYLESLGGMPPSMPLEDHIGELSISLDLSVAQQPQDEQVPELLARSGVTGASAELCDSGLQLVQALKSQEELQSFIRRILASSWRKVKDDEASAQEFAKFAQDFSAGDDSFQKLRERLRKASWIELNLRAGEDRMKIGVAMEKEARELEAAGQAEEALEGFHRAIAVQKLVYNFDDRCKNNAQIKELVGKKIASLEDDVKRLSPSEEQATPIDDLEARLRKLRE